MAQRQRQKLAAYSVGGALSIALLAGSVWLFAQPKRTAGPAGPPGGFAVPVEAQTVRVGLRRKEAEAIGNLRSWESVILKPEVTGRVVKIGFEEGTFVKAGTLLVELDTAEAEAEVLRSKAALELAKETASRAPAASPMSTRRWPISPQPRRTSSWPRRGSRRCASWRRSTA